MNDVKYASDAMRIGVRARGKAIGIIYDRVNRTTCALGAVMEGIGLNMPNWVVTTGRNYHDVIYDKFTYLEHQFVVCPACNRSAQIAQVIAHLNNTGYKSMLSTECHNWSREAIADWLEGVEYLLGVRELPSAEKPEPIEEPELVGA